MAIRRTQRARPVEDRLFLGVGLVLCGIVLGAFFGGILAGLERQSVDVRFAVRGEREPGRELVIVAIDDVTFDELGLQWPFPRSEHALVIDRIDRDGPRVIVYDVQFTEETDPFEDNALIEAVADADSVVLATTEVDEFGGTNIFGGIDLAALGARAGTALVAPERGGVIRRAPYEVEGLETLAIVGAEVASGREIEASEVPSGNAWIDFYGPEGTIPAVSFSRVSEAPPGFFSDRIVVVGASAPSLQDLHATSTADTMSGAEVEASALSTALRGFPLREAHGSLAVALIVGLALVAPLCGLRFRLLWIVTAGIASGAVLLIAAQLAFNEGWIVPVVHPLAAAMLGTVGAIVVAAIAEAFERQRTRDVFARFVPEGVVDTALQRTDADLRLGGVELTGTVMFSDLRGFTRFVESVSAEEVITVLNRYLTDMSEAIGSHGGTIVSYMGDGIMAVFGAPIEQHDHADRAVGAAREMLRVELPRLNEWLRAQDLEPFAMGIGIASGAVMSGNVGSRRRLEYAAVGNPTNTASRLEAMTRELGLPLLIADATVSLLRGPAADLVAVGELPLRGKSGGTRVWSFAEPRDDQPGPQKSPTTLAE